MCLPIRFNAHAAWMRYNIGMMNPAVFCGTGRYYVNRETRETSWDKPKGFGATATPAPAVADAAALNARLNKKVKAVPAVVSQRAFLIHN